MDRVVSRFARKNLWALCCVLLAIALALSQLAAGPQATEVTGTADAIIYMSDPQVVESSGLAKSNRAAGCFWTHNDSGHPANLYAFDGQGVATGSCTLHGVAATDFEDIASYVQDGAARLLLADVGDNRSRRPFVSLYFFDEPDPRRNQAVKDWYRLDLRYPDGPRDCEAIAVDVTAGKVILVSKTFLPHASVYHVDLPPRGAVTDANQAPQTLQLIGNLPLSLVTAMDHDDTTGDTLLVNYFQLFRFAKPQPGQNWWQQTPRAADLPKLKQIEAVAVDRGGAVWVTSEGKPAPLVRVKEPALQELPQ